MKYKTIGSLLFILIISLFFFKKVWAQGSNIPSSLIFKIMLAESSLNPKAIGPAGERGLFQLSKETWNWLTPKIYGKVLDFDLAFDSAINKKVGIYYLNWLKEQLGVHYTPALLVASYNYGIGRIKSLGYKLPASAYNHPNLIYRQIFRTGA
jgi:soluble lytic murein transglycosylase-like protein